MTTPDEFSNKKTVTIGLIVWVAAISFSMGMIYARIVDHTKDINGAREFTEQEVGGSSGQCEEKRWRLGSRASGFREASPPVPGFAAYSLSPLTREESPA